MGKVARSAWINDDGTRTKGTPLNDAELQKIFDGVEADTLSANYPAINTKSTIDNAIVQGVFSFGGNDAVDHTDLAYPTGATYFTGAGAQVLAQNTRYLELNSALLQQGTYLLEAMMRVNSGAYTVTAGLFNLTDSPDATPVAEIASSSTTGALVTSAAIVFPAPGAVKVFGVKVKVNNVNALGRVWGIRLVRLN